MGWKQLFVAAVTVIFLTRLLWRRFGPLPSTDVEAIDGWLSVNSQKSVRIQPLLFGGPWRVGRVGIPSQIGHPYRVWAREPDGSQWVHVIAIDGRTAAGQPHVRERVNGAWSA